MKEPIMSLWTLASGPKRSAVTFFAIAMVLPTPTASFSDGSRDLKMGSCSIFITKGITVITMMVDMLSSRACRPTILLACFVQVQMGATAANTADQPSLREAGNGRTPEVSQAKILPDCRRDVPYGKDEGSSTDYGYQTGFML